MSLITRSVGAPYLPGSSDGVKSLSRLPAPYRNVIATGRSRGRLGGDLHRRRGRLGRDRGGARGGGGVRGLLRQGGGVAVEQRDDPEDDVAEHDESPLGLAPSFVSTDARAARGIQPWS